MEAFHIQKELVGKAVTENIKQQESIQTSAENHALFLAVSSRNHYSK